MSAPYAAEIKAYVGSVKGIVYQGPWSGALGTPMLVNLRY